MKWIKKRCYLAYLRIRRFCVRVKVGLPEVVDEVCWPVPGQCLIRPSPPGVLWQQDHPEEDPRRPALPREVLHLKLDRGGAPGGEVGLEALAEAEDIGGG